MNEPRTFLYEPAVGHEIYYDVHEKGLIYRPENGEIFQFNWEDIQYIEDRPGYQVDIFLNSRKEVPVRYATKEFCVLLKTICLKLSDIRKEDFHSLKFTLTLKYFLHLSFVVSVLVASLIGCLLLGNVMFFLLLALLLPIGIFILRQPIALTLNSRSLMVRNLFLETAVNYNEIRKIDFAVKSNDYGSTLCVLIDLKNGTQMTIKQFENIILFFIMLQIKLNECMGNGDSEQN